MPKRQVVAVTEPIEVVAEDRLALLEGFVSLINERWGYYTARKLTQQDMSEKTKEQSKRVRELSKAVSKGIEEFLETPEQEIKDAIVQSRKDIVEAKKKVKEAREPFQKKITPLAKAMRYLDSVAIPDSLKELGKPIQPLFSLSDWVTTAIASKKK